MSSQPPRLAAFEPSRAASRLELARLTDRSRLALLLQGAGVLAHLDAAGWHLSAGWEGGRVTTDGVLRLAPPAAGLGRTLNQDLLLDLVARLFGSSEVGGRGQGRRAARLLVRGWSQALTALEADGAVGEIFEQAPFLWTSSFAPARRTLVGEHRRGKGWNPRVAGPLGARRSLGAQAQAAVDESAEGVGNVLRELLGGDEARRFWLGAGAGEPSRLSAAGRWASAVSAWVERPPRGARERGELATALFSLGQFEKALKALHGLRGIDARLLRTRCQYRLGQLRAAEGSLRRLATVSLTAEQTVGLAEVAVRILANRGKQEAAESWVSRAAQRSRASGRPALIARVHLLRALVAWDAGKTGPMKGHLDKARAVLNDRRFAWRWHFAASLAAAAAGEVEDALGELSSALTLDRRRLRCFEVGQLWNEIGICRARLGDLAGAQRAFAHTVRLLGRCEGPRRTTLALYNLAEIRLRRGQLIGVRSIIEEATLENRLADNVRGSIQDAELWARLELAQGKAQAALIHCTRTLDRLEDLGLDWRRAELSTLAARALGWLGRADEAAAMLAVSGAPVAGELEAEEMPALWALAGDRDRALRAAAGSPLEALWLELLTTGEAHEAAWRGLEELEPFRAARLVFDLELVAPASTPAVWLRRAAATLRRLEAGGLASRLEARDLGPWMALADYLDSRAREGDAEPSSASVSPSIAKLFSDSGYGDVALSWRQDTSPSETEETVLLAGVGGGEELVAKVDGGCLILRASRLDDIVRVLFSLAVHDFVGLAANTTSAGWRGRGGMVGESVALRAAQERLSLLAVGEMPVLVLGATGTGKELAAKMVHQLSPRAQRPFVAVNCAAFSETLLLADLFGHVRGSFTGADRERAGIFETARRGTVFLDEIGDLPASAQGMLLRVLQEGEVRRLGESLARKVDVRVVAATHRDLAEMVREGSFRQDLFYRLNGAQVELPPLRQRGDDLLLLANHFLGKLSARSGVAEIRLSQRALTRLRSHPWPGNIRELESVLTVAFALRGKAKTIGADHLDLPREQQETSSDYQSKVDSYRKDLLCDALTAAGGNQAAAARRLGLTRQALSYLVKQLKLRT